MWGILVEVENSFKNWRNGNTGDIVVETSGRAMRVCAVVVFRGVV